MSQHGPRQPERQGDDSGPITPDVAHASARPCRAARLNEAQSYLGDRQGKMSQAIFCLSNRTGGAL